MGYSVVKFSLTKNRKDISTYKVIITGKLTGTITSLKYDEVVSGFAQYKSSIRKLFKKYKPDGVIAERFMSRGLRGSLGEYIGAMLTLIIDLTIFYHTKIKKVTPVIMPIAAVTWKNRVNKVFDLKHSYKICQTEPHELDATLMAFYLMENMLGIEPVMQYQKLKGKGWRTLLKCVAKASISRLINRKMK